MSWLDIAKQLKTGDSVRVPCCIGCKKSTSNNMIISSNLNGYSGYCFKCSSKVYEKRGDLTLKELQLIHTQEAVWKTKCALPEDFTTDIPTPGRLWLAGAGLHEDVYKKYGVGYSPGMNRVILPIYGSGGLIGMQARSLNELVKPKYLSNFLDKNPLFISHKYAKNSAILVIVEDILSAIKIGEHFSSCAMLGTYASANVLTLARLFSHVVLWYDGDKAGKRCNAVTKRRLSAMGIPSVSISTELDPKRYSGEEITGEVLSALT